MNKWEATNFLPKWARTEEDRELLSNMPDVGVAPDPVPSLATRILPIGGGSRISAATLSDAILLKQRIINYATYEVVRGIDPTFADLRKIDEECLLLARLDFEPFDEGSFVIPAELRAAPIPVKRDGATLLVSTTDVIERFNEVLRDLPDKGIDMNVSIGLLTEINAFGKLLKREVESVEFTTMLPQETMLDTRRKSARHCVDANYLARVESIRKTRQRIQKIAGVPLVGTLVAVDFENHKLKIRLDAHAQTTIIGTFLPPLERSLLSNLMRKAQFIGTVTFDDRTPRHIDVVKVEAIKDA